MLFTCAPADASRGGSVARSQRGRHFTMDMHCHIQVPKADALVKHLDRPAEPLFAFASDATRAVNKAQFASIWPKLTSVDVRLADMDAGGIDMQALSPAPGHYHYWAPPELGRETARVVNDSIAALVQRHPDRFVGLGTIPLQNTEFAISELNRVVADHGFRGIEIGTNVNGSELADERLRRVFARAEALDVVVFLHPNRFTDGRRLSEHYLNNIIGNPLESTIAVSHLIFGGVLDAYPRLKVCVAHGGGFLPTYSGRMDHAYAARSDCRQCIAHPPSHYLRRMYFDTVVYTSHQLEYLVAQYGADHILMGTDYPYDMAESDPVGHIHRSALTAEQQAEVLGLAAARLMKIDPARLEPGRRS